LPPRETATDAWSLSMMIPIRPIALALVLIGSATCAQSPPQRLTQEEFSKIHKELTSAKEPWQSIPWHVSLLEARAQAVKENKPIYMLCRAGHPLGCV